MGLRKGPQLSAAAALLLCGVSAAYGEIRLQKVRWQLSERLGTVQKFNDIKAVKLDGPKIPGKLRARLTLDNRGPRPIEGILLKYALTARLVPLSGNSEGVWAVPFLVDEKRVPRIGPNQIQEVSLISSALVDVYLRKIARVGFYPGEIKLQIMVEPRDGGDKPLQTLESALRFTRG